MSTIADFRMIEKIKLQALRESASPKKGFFGRIKDNYFTFLDQNSMKLIEYKGSGYLYATLLVYLEENGIDLMDSDQNELAAYISEERESTFFIFTEEHKVKYMDKLNPPNFNEEELEQYYNDFNGTDEDGIGKELINGIAILQKNIKQIKENSVILLGIY